MTYKEAQHCRPPFCHNFGGGHVQPFAAPRIVHNADGRIDVQVQKGKIGVVQDARKEMASNYDRYIIAAL